MKLEPDDLQQIAAAVAELLRQQESNQQLLPADRLGYPEAEAAELLGLPKHVLRDCRLRGEIVARLVGKSYCYSRQTLLDFLKGRAGK